MDLSKYNNEFINYLTNCNKNNTNEFKFTNNECKIVKVIDVYDGDTIIVAMSIHPKKNTTDLVYQFKVRMWGYNTEEIRQPLNDPYREEKHQWAIYQRDWIKDKILNKIVILECLGYDKYGRILGKVYLDNEKTKCINDIIVSNNIAVKYIQ
jgi:endonuclease YncB( thermonuclease family)